MPLVNGKTRFLMLPHSLSFLAEICDPISADPIATRLDGTLDGTAGQKPPHEAACPSLLLSALYLPFLPGSPSFKFNIFHYPMFSFCQCKVHSLLSYITLEITCILTS